jgi:hypothetical protein
MPTPREIALATNAGIEPLTEADADPSADVANAGGKPKEADYRANPANPPDGPAPAKNLKGG